MINLTRLLSLLLLITIFFPDALPQDAANNETAESYWPESCREVEITSMLDGKTQRALYIKSTGTQTMPLIISLHTWSGNFKQKDTLAWTCYRKNYNYIHPDFRGPNNNPEACGSQYVIQDIEDAISFAIEQGNVDMDRIHVIGASGGGYATLLTYMNTKHPVKTFSAWVPISDLTRWYYESTGRGSKYANDIAQSIVKGAGEANKRSPYHMKTPVDLRRNSKLYIYAGIHDGYTGSVPITQSMQFYNKVVSEFDISETGALIPEKDMLEMVTARHFIREDKGIIGDRQLHYERNYKDQVRIVIFEGGHEMLSDVALDHVEARRILTIGDSNGAAIDGWVNQLRKIRFDDFIYNASVSGNTIGFDNLGTSRLNTLKNIDSYLKNAEDELNGMDDIVLMLGTNDCKAVFQDSLKSVPKHLKTLLRMIKTSGYYQKNQPRIYVVSPPPFGKDEIMAAKYHGGADRMAWLQPKLKQTAIKHGCIFVDVYSKLEPLWSYYAPEGIHPAEEAQIIAASVISESMDQ